MKVKKIAGLMIIILSFTAGLYAQGGQRLLIPLSQPGKPYKLNIDIVMGSINITAYDGKDIVIDTRTNERERQEERYIKSDMKRISNNSSDVLAREKDNTVSISMAVPYRLAVLNIKIPKGSTNIKLSTVNGGSVNADGIEGDIEVNNTNGAIKLYNISGSVVANTVNGAILATFKNVDSKAAMAFSTLNGAINVTFPADFKANIKARSDRGKVHSEFDIVTEKTAVTAKGKNGMFQINNDWITGKIGGGGPEVLFKNLLGNIYIHKAN